MRGLLILLFSCSMLSFRGLEQTPAIDEASPLTIFSAEWDKPEYRVCNTAAEVTYLSEKEKQIIYILNMARMNPALFAKSVVMQYPEYSGEESLKQSDYFRSLLEFLKNKKTMPLLTPEKTLFESAKCHAESSGSSGYVGHNRQTAACRSVETFMGECCQYGYADPISIVLDLLIDEGVPSLGHRIILFKPHTQIGVSLQPHKKYRWNAVLDLG
jgi:uncharacterized protein YkwD